MLHESTFGLGLTYDTLTLEPYSHGQRHVEVNATVILAFVEAVLGYKLTNTSGAGFWEFRRDVGFRP